MDNLVSENIIKKVRIRDIFASLKDIISENKTSKDEIEIEKRLQEIYKTEKELGATGSIENLTTELQTHETPKKKRSAKSKDGVAKINRPIRARSNSADKLKNKEEKEVGERQ